MSKLTHQATLEHTQVVQEEQCLLHNYLPEQLTILDAVFYVRRWIESSQTLVN